LVAQRTTHLGGRPLTNDEFQTYGVCFSSFVRRAAREADANVRTLSLGALIASRRERTRERALTSSLR
jgi:hypothetical protein